MSDDATRTPDSGGEWLIRLYVAGMNPTARRALENLEAILADHLGDGARVEVVDLHERPELAEDEKIFAVPTAVRHLPEPVRKVVGDLSDTEKTLVGLDIRPVS